MISDWEELERVTQKYENMLKMILWFVDNDGFVIPVREY
jgi:hypothetical protein